jgi:hypothetical protein
MSDKLQFVERIRQIQGASEQGRLNLPDSSVPTGRDYSIEPFVQALKNLPKLIRPYGTKKHSCRETGSEFPELSRTLRFQNQAAPAKEAR